MDAILSELGQGYGDEVLYDEDLELHVLPILFRERNDEVGDWLGQVR